MTGEIVELGKLLGVIRDALIGAVAVSVLFSLAIVGLVRVRERHEQSSTATFGYAALTAICVACCVALVVLGVALLASK